MLAAISILMSDPFTEQWPRTALIIYWARNSWRTRGAYSSFIFYSNLLQRLKYKEGTYESESSVAEGSTVSLQNKSVSQNEGGVRLSNEMFGRFVTQPTEESSNHLIKTLHEHTTHMHTHTNYSIVCKTTPSPSELQTNVYTSLLAYQINNNTKKVTTLQLFFLLKSLSGRKTKYIGKKKI